MFLQPDVNFGREQSVYSTFSRLRLVAANLRRGPNPGIFLFVQTSRHFSHGTRKCGKDMFVKDLMLVVLQ